MSFEFTPVGGQATVQVATPPAQPTVPAPAEAAPKEPAAAEPAPDAAKADASAKRFAEMARREKAVAAARAEAKAEAAKVAAERQAIETDRAEIARQRQESEARRQRYAENPAAILEDNDLSFEELQNFIANNHTMTADQKVALLAKQVEKMKADQVAEREAATKRVEEQTTAESQAIIDNFKTGITDFVEQNAADYDLIRAYKSQALIFEVVEAYYAKTGQILTVKQAADAVESDLFAKVDQATSTPGYQKRLASKQPPQVAPEAKPKAHAGEEPQFQAQPSRTLSNDEFRASTPTLLSSPSFEEERMKRAMAALG